MTNELPLLLSDILSLWSLSCRTVRQIIIQYQTSGRDYDHRAALNALSDLDRLKWEILPLLKEQEQKERVEWDHLTVLHLHSLIGHGQDKSDSRSDGFSQAVKLAKTLEIERILAQNSQ